MAALIMGDYPDTGCKAGGPSCLACPLPKCVHDERRPISRATLEQRQKRDSDALRLWDEGMKIAVIAKQLSIDHQTVRRSIDRRAQGKQQVGR